MFHQKNIDTASKKLHRFVGKGLLRQLRDKENLQSSSRN